MHILIALTYYRPHYSGLTIYSERLAKALAGRKHHVTVLTSRFDPQLPARELRDGVEIIRPWVLMRVSKGVLMPTMPLEAWKYIRRADVVNLHVPQLDAAPIALISRGLGKHVVMTYHCDLRLPKGAIHAVANQVSHLANHITARSAEVIVTNTRDYAENSYFLRNYLDKVHVIPPPVTLPKVTEADLEVFRRKFNIHPGEKIIGMVARLAAEKGVEYLIEAIPAVIKENPQARVLFVGQYQNVLGEEQYAQMLAPKIKNLGAHWSFLGVVTPVELAAFYQVCDVTVLPSTNGTESFGMVQVEAMSRGTPVVASDIPGVRQPVLLTGMGKLVPPRSPDALAYALNAVLCERDRYRGNGAEVTQRFSPENIAIEYEQLFLDLIGKR
ncbi:MAG: glycosyltransferase family 4 protein [Chloroflexi bacterium]|nr:glycosyltransferase family 4 protein [Chloroflexota bacterium]